MTQVDAGPVSSSMRTAKIARFVLMGAIATLVCLIVANSQNNQGSINPLMVNKAQADIAAAPGYIALTTTIGQASHFYIMDTDKKVICLYATIGDKLRLVSARKFDYDSDIFAGDIGAGKHGSGIEGGNGITREEAKGYSEAIKQIFESQTTKKK